MNWRVWLAVPTLAMAPSFAMAQDRHPDFSGTWALADSAMAAPSIATRGDAAFQVGDMGSGWGSRLTLAHSADQLTVEYVYFSTYDLQPPLRYIFALDGAESINHIMIGHTASEQRSRATWRGDTLVITTQYPAPDGNGAGAAEVRQALHLVAADRLEIETTRVGVNGAPSRVSRTRYIRN